MESPRTAFEPVSTAGTRASHALFVLSLVAYLVATLPALDVYPRVGVDEPWIAAAPYKLATDGILGSDLFTGLFGMERHHYQHMPVYPILEAAVFKMLGAGVWQMRLLSVVFGFFLLLATFLVGRSIGDVRVGALAALLLVLLRITDGDEITGILLLDRARINRYDIAVPVFGLFALLIASRRRATLGRGSAFSVGVLTGLSSLSHLYGVFWFVTLAAFTVSSAERRRAVRALGWLVLGFAMSWAPWLVAISFNWTDFLGQMRTVSERFDVLSPSFYLTNAVFADGPLSLMWVWTTVRGLPLSRVGTWTTVLALPVAAWLMVRHTRARRDAAVWPLAVAGGAQLVFFFVLIQAKTINYMIALWPLAVLALAWASAYVWDHARLKIRTMVRTALVVIAVAVGIEGTTRMVHAARVAARMTPYDWYMTEVGRCIPKNARVLGLTHYWLGLREYPFRAWFLPLFETNPRFTDTPVPFNQAIDRVDPDVILIDRYMTEMFEQTADPRDPLHRLVGEYEAFLATRRVTPVCVVRDRTYGAMHVYHIARR